jgi:putative ABC transport system permease protein
VPVELLVGPFNCEQRTRGEKPADGPAVPLEIPMTIAQRHGLQLGEELPIPGLPPGSAHLGWTFPEFDRVEGINGGVVLLAPSADIAARMLSSPGYATGAFVLSRSRPTSTASSPPKPNDSGGSDAASNPAGREARL